MKSTSQTVENAVGDDIELNLACSTIVKSTESTTAMDTSGKSDARDTSGASVDKKSVKKKKKKTKPSPSPSPQKKMKKDPNKPDYPKVGMYKNFETASIFFHINFDVPKIDKMLLFVCCFLFKDTCDL